MTRIASNPFSIQVQGTLPQVTGLDFPSNGDSPSSAFVAFQFLNPHLDGLPIWGPGGAGATLIWRLWPRQHTGYYTTFFWANNGPFGWNGGNSNTYYGCHPYPYATGPNGTVHYWEIASSTGGDETISRAGTQKEVIKGIWYTQALRVVRNGDGTKNLIFYTSLPSVANPDVIEYPQWASYGESNPPNPALTFGDAPWSQGNERMSGILRGIKIFNRLLSEADMLAEAASDNLVTAAGQANIWWKKINPTPNDLLCEAGTGRNPQWAQATRASLWTG
jgi:hypothetical protein